jgi:hypothetical protein
MKKRLLKLIYVLSLTAIVLSFPIHVLTSIDYGRVYSKSYKAKCLSNDKYVVLQGSPSDEGDDFLDLSLTGENGHAYNRQLNFYCKYYDEIRPFIVSYRTSNSNTEQYQNNLAFTAFEKSKNYDQMFTNPKLYELELVKKDFQPWVVFGPIIDWLTVVGGLFIIIQIIKICYIYVVYGKIVYHPFKLPKD